MFKNRKCLQVNQHFGKFQGIRIQRSNIQAFGIRDLDIQGVRIQRFDIWGGFQPVILLLVIYTSYLFTKDKILS